jgi:hypothetical protein
VITPGADDKGRIVRVLTYGKEPGVVDQAILDAVEGGHRVLVKVSSMSDTPAAQSAGASAVADWAGALSRTHGLAWARVGGDVLFHRSVSRAAPSENP